MPLTQSFAGTLQPNAAHLIWRGEWSVHACVPHDATANPSTRVVPPDALTRRCETLPGAFAHEPESQTRNIVRGGPCDIGGLSEDPSVAALCDVRFC